MLFIKKLDIFVLRKFLQLFVGAFFVCLFVFMMQFTWRYVDELIGKGLSLSVLGHFFWYMGMSLVPTSLPLAVLLASLITFGNMGESLELLSMKAAGVSLVRVMRPIFFIVILLTGVSFYFQNVIGPQAQLQLRQLLISMKQTSPALEIPEGVFYGGVPNVNIYVQRKEAETGMLYQTIIYKTDQGFEKAQIVLADSAKMEMTADKMHLRLKLWNGEQFENLQNGAPSQFVKQANTPYDRETFAYKELVIDFDSNFSLMDADNLRMMAATKDMKEIEQTCDTLTKQLDSLGRQNYADCKQMFYSLQERDKKVKVAKATMPFDSIVAIASSINRSRAITSAMQRAQQLAYDYQWKADVQKDYWNVIRRHWIEWHQKMTLSLACLLFFFVGAPLGAIIRKGGLGLPAVISVIIFIFYYIINTSGMKMGREGRIPIWVGMWISFFILAPIGAFLTYKSNRDSIIFNIDTYINSIKHIFKKRR